MTQSIQFNTARRTFLIVFIASSVLALLFGVVYSLASFSTPPVSPQHPSSSGQVVEIGGLVAGLASCLTSIVSFLGFLATVFFSWRKEKRESQVSELERKRLEIELEKQRLEVSRLRAEEKK